VRQAGARGHGGAQGSASEIHGEERDRRQEGSTGSDSAGRQACAQHWFGPKSSSLAHPCTVSFFYPFVFPLSFLFYLFKNANLNLLIVVNMYSYLNVIFDQAIMLCFIYLRIYFIPYSISSSLLFFSLLLSHS
jgi:hypothetical protein